MKSEKIAGILGGIVALLVLAVAFYDTFRQRALPPAKQPDTAVLSKGPINPPPVGKGPVVREVPQ
jgi:hypothetical protein